MDSSGDGGNECAGAAPAGSDESSAPAPAPSPSLVLASAAVGGGAGASGSSGKVKRVMKTPYQLEVLERTYTEDPYPNETVRAELSVKLGLTDRQLQMWFCHRRLKDRSHRQSDSSWRRRFPCQLWCRLLCCHQFHTAN
ncbi:hypothetical protein GUJ93_ZPchr0005g15579 [Zizania palustris]|uniref:Homeobox domain-containing protein n=1 Tax=Zizania palustris TaxID=103762 RepID=A0A8J5W233_ZIZPA|nr:hypothetical protein GUJ93_ZPchr0005g15579 [Zizania palustris]